MITKNSDPGRVFRGRQDALDGALRAVVALRDGYSITSQDLLTSLYHLVAAERLRDQGYSYRLIHERLGIPMATLSSWFKNMSFEPNKEVRERMRNGPRKAGIEKRAARIKSMSELREAGIKELGMLSKRDLWLLGIGLYIGEGSKSIEQVRIVNADPEVIRLCIRWFKRDMRTYRQESNH